MKDLLPQIQSTDGLFHNGNPATGEQGTRVTDVWLNDVQAHLRDFGEEFKYLLQQAQLTPIPSQKTQIYQAIQAVINNNIPTASLAIAGKVQLSSATDSEDEDKAATSKAVKTAYDKGVEAYDLANSKQSPATTLAGYGIADFKVETAQGNLNNFRTPGMYSFTSMYNSSNRPGNFTGNLQVVSGGANNERWCHQVFYRHYSDEVYERYQASGSDDNWSEWKKRGSDGIPVGSVVAFPKEVNSPQGFLRCDGTSFRQQTYPDLYRALGNKNKLPNLTRSDVGQLAYFPTDNIPSGWLACNGGTISANDYPELHRYLGSKYGSNRLPNAEDRFIRNAGNGLRVGQVQKASLLSINDNDNSVMGLRLGYDDNVYSSFVEKMGLDGVHSRDYPGVLQTWTGRDADNSLIGASDATNIYPNHAVGGTRPKSIVFKLCIKAKNSFDDVQFWIKAFGEVQNVGSLDAGRLAQDLHNHTHTASQITDFNPEVVKLINQYSGFTQQIAENGWTVLPNGLMIQWGVSTSTEIYFPRAFPRACFVVSHSKTNGNRDTRVNNITNTKFNSYASSHPGTTYYVAIGH